MKRSIILLLGIALMLATALMSPVRYELPPTIFVDSNFENFAKELAERNMSEPYECLPPEMILVTCQLEDDWQLNRTIETLNKFPHSTMGLHDGYGDINVIVLNESEFYSKMSDICRIWGKVPLKSSPSNREELKAELDAYKELEGVIKDPKNKKFIHNKTVILEYALGLRSKEPVCNATWANVILIYPLKKTSNAPLMATLWLGVVLMGIIGVIMVWKEKDS